MSLRGRVLAALALSAASLVAASQPAGAAIIQDKGGALSATSGIVLGPDGNFWVAEQYADSVVRLSPAGAVLNRYAVSGEPTTVANGPGGRVWVAVTGAKKLTWFDASNPSPTAHDVTIPSNTCGPVALVAGGGRMFFSLPSDGTCNGGLNRLGSVADTGMGAVTTSPSGGGKSFDLDVAGGRLYAPDIDGDVVRRLTLDAAPVVDDPGATVALPGGPDQITAVGTTLWVTEVNTGHVSRFPAGQAGGSAQSITPTGGALTQPGGIVGGADGRIYVTGQKSANLVRISADGTQFKFYGVPDGEPYQIVNGPDGDLWFTDQVKTRVLRLLDAPPRAATGVATATAPVSAAVQGTVDPRGNDTQVVVDYGPTTTYGATTGPTTVPAGAVGVPFTGVLAGLKPATTYHVRLRATNAEGAVAGADAVFTTPPGIIDADGDGVSPPTDCNDRDPKIRPGAVDKPGDKIDQDCSGEDAAYPELDATTAFSAVTRKTSATVRTIEVSRLRGGETITLRCTGKRCAFKTKRYTKAKKGKRTFGRSVLKNRSLPAGTSISVRVTKSQYVGTFTALTVRRATRPRVTRSCLRPGATKPTKCT